ncbi:hypothetical protein CROQUDRAFT_101511 [Cronartium quercuum f. sp. fusiforme G11]|uniref:Uncharacterized protein n=1 Tax=Cronartium quercuum f. sp. fusiforme G11 TaxID=708437 RepID=A0A9P6N859_9BASI|nr:hypothetical protein CROQUDRAFT_101511 [Cronartium quercuum f. sp. fusiforme G11]
MSTLLYIIDWFIPVVILGPMVGTLVYGWFIILTILNLQITAMPTINSANNQATEATQTAATVAAVSIAKAIALGANTTTEVPNSSGKEEKATVEMLKGDIEMSPATKASVLPLLNSNIQ